MKKLSLTSQIFIALLLAIGAGLALQNFPDFVNGYIKPWGTIFLNLLKFIVVPLVIFSIMSAIFSMNDITKIGKLGGRALLYFMCTTIIATCLGLLLPTLIKSGLPKIEIDIASLAGRDVHHFTLIDQIVNFFPSNIVQPIANMTMMQVIVIGLFFAVAIVHIGEKGEEARKLVLCLDQVTQRVLWYIMAISPFGVFCLLTPVVVVNGPTVLGSYAALIGLDYGVFICHILLVYLPALMLLGKMNPIKFFKNIGQAMLFAYSSDSSVATIPYTIAGVEKLGVRKDISEFVIPLGATVNMDGVAIYLCVSAVFFANCLGIDLTMNDYFALAFSATIASIGTPGIPGGSLALMAMVFASAGIPVECVAIAAGIDRLVDMARTVMSITGDASCAVVMETTTGHIFDKK
ncbi:MAG: dicarboxylate/amino acid:cation symporter [Paludibacteraceae bacterium]|nr:dicarboxylate/amino acid:cation symporter [Paludibacteraceae bacterium]